MATSIFKQAAEILRKRKKSRQRQNVVLGLALLTVAGTTAILIVTGQALTKKDRVKILDCQLEVHEHKDECYDGNNELICGYADFVIHEHNSDCYDSEGKLVCRLPEIELHEHDEETCFEEAKILICEKEEGEIEEVSGDVGQEQDVPANETPSHDSGSSNDSNNNSGNSNDGSSDNSSNSGGSSEKILTCGKEEHSHANDSQAETLVCGKGEHSHGDGCRDEEGNVTCGTEEHSHGSGCYETTTSCDKEEHTHSDTCYSVVESSSTGDEAAAVSTENNVENTIETAGAEEGSVGVDNNTEESNTGETAGTESGSAEETIGTENGNTGETAGTENGNAGETAGTENGNAEETIGTEAVEDGEEAEGHIHTEECYEPDPEAEPVLICEELAQELHTHIRKAVEDGGCYDSSAFDEETGEFIEGSPLVCGLLQLVEHVHTEECFTDDLDQIITQTFEGDGFIVTAEYTGRAYIPDDAELRAEMVPDDSAHYEEREAEYKEVLDDERASMRALMKIGFYMGDEEIEPRDVVTITVQFLDEDGLADGLPITVVHFAEEGAEVLDGGEAEDQSTTFKMKSFSEIAIGYSRNKTESIYVSQKFAYEDDAFQITFHVNGEVKPADEDMELPEEATDIITNKIREVVIIGNTTEDEADSVNEAEETETADTEENQEKEETADSAENTEDKADAAEEEKEESAEEQEAAAAEEEKESETAEAASEEEAETADAVSEEEPEKADAADDSEAETADAAEEEQETADAGESDQNASDVQAKQKKVKHINNEEFLEFRMETLDEKSEAYKTIADYAEETGNANDGSKQLMLKVMGYSLFYDDMELDLSDCTVTAEIVPTQELKDYVEGNAPALESFEIKEDETDEDMSHDVKVEIFQLADEEHVVQSAEMEVKSGDESVSVGTEPAAQADSVPAVSESAAQAVDVQEESAVEISGGIFNLFRKARNAGLQTNNASAVDTVDSVENAAPAAVQTFQSSEEVMFTLDTGNAAAQVFAMRASGQPNPHFTIQYYANLNLLAEKGANELTLIDTSGKKLPVNGNTTSPTGKFKYMYVDSAGKLLMENKLTEVYTSREFEYYKAPTINYMNALVENVNYELKEIWVLKDGSEADSVDDTDWDVYTYNENLHFTNREVSGGSGKYVYIKDNAVIRFVYNTTVNTEKDFSAAFYDYDISSGRVHRARPPVGKGPDYYVYKTAGQTFSGNSLTSEVLNWAAGLSDWDGHLYAYTQEQGINSSGNYSGSGTKLAFGNVNTGTGLGRNKWSNNGKNNELNKYNNASYQGCTFGLVTGMSGGKIQYASNINAPKLFNEGSATGKTAYDKGEYSLKFNRVGDTYTLSAVNGTGATNLGNFSHPTNSTGTHTSIWTNNFWPMDSAPSFGTGTHDVKFGATATFKGGTHEIRFGPTTEKEKDYTFPESDDGLYHNSYFGMHYEVEFELVEDYIGPLEYYFFGDDDMWVFLDGKLVCDIGGVHSSVGEYVNLWDYLTKDSKGKHTLSFFYTERGASGSTCWMQFTLPSVSSLTPETTDKDYGELKISKTVTQIAGENETVVDNNDEFHFTLHLADSNGNNLPDDYSYIKYDKNDNEIGHDLIIWDGGEFTLKNGEYIIIKYIPQGAHYEITEADAAYTVIDNINNISEENSNEYITDITIDGTLGEDKENLSNEKVAEGDVPKGGTAVVEYNNKFYAYVLPKTGGSGTNMYYILAGALFIIFGAGVIYKKKSEKEVA